MLFTWETVAAVPVYPCYFLEFVQGQQSLVEQELRIVFSQHLLTESVDRSYLPEERYQQWVPYPNQQVKFYNKFHNNYNTYQQPTN